MDGHAVCQTIRAMEGGAAVPVIFLTAQGVTLRATAGVRSLRGDAELLRRVLENLEENAVRHSPKGASVRVEVAPYDDALDILVIDQRAGVPEAMREAVFQRSVQLGEGENIRGGRGLGLTFCKLAVEARGGRIWVEDAHPGAVFRLRLPRRAGA